MEIFFVTVLSYFQKRQAAQQQYARYASDCRDRCGKNRERQRNAEAGSKEMQQKQPCKPRSDAGGCRSRTMLPRPCIFMQHVQSHRAAGENQYMRRHAQPQQQLMNQSSHRPLQQNIGQRKQKLCIGMILPKQPDEAEQQERFAVSMCQTA